MLKGKSAVVTGSTSGIGLGIARALAAEGANLMLNGFGDAGEIEKLRAGLAAEFKVKVAFNGADMSKPAQIRDMIAAATRELGAVDILVNNAGIQHTAAVEQFPDDRWDAVIAINLSANFHAIKAALPQMKSRNWGRIINIASVHGLVASTAEDRLRRRQARRGRAHQGGRPRDREDRHHLQRHLPRLGADAAGAEADRRPRRRARAFRSSRPSTTCWRRSSPRSNSRRRSRSARSPCSCARRRRRRSAARRCRSTAAGWRSNGIRDHA